MGARQFRRSTPVQSKHELARKRESASLQKSREEYLSKILQRSLESLNQTAEGNKELKNENANCQAEKLKEIVCQEKTMEEAESFLEKDTIMFADQQDAELNCDDGVLGSASATCRTDVSTGLASDNVKHYMGWKRYLVAKAAQKQFKIKKGRTSFQPVGRYDRSSSFYDQVDRQAATIHPEDFEFAFENLVFEGGGNKGLAYCGAVRYLEELGVMKHVKCFAGASAGGMLACLMAVGYNSYEIEQFLSERIDRVFLDAACGYFSLLPNLLHNFGWNPGRRIHNWFGDKLKVKTGDADVTFQQVYQKFGKILCVVVTNLSQMTTEYCHPKTTPEMPVRMAIRMSMAIPGLFSAIKYDRNGHQDVYVDGGVLCNYPIHCFDGWYLSMAPEDSFIRKMQPLKEIPRLMDRHNRFGTYNQKSLGMLLYSDAEEDILRMRLESRVGCLIPAKPDKETKLYIERQKETKLKQKAAREYARVVEAVDSFLRVLKKHDIDQNDIITMNELERAFKDETEFPREQAEVLFGKDFTVNQACSVLDRDNNGQIHYDELVRFIEENGVSLQSRFLGCQRKEIKNFVAFLDTLQNCLIFNVKRLYVEERDLERTVGINTGHIQTTDFVLKEPDRDFVVQRGYNSMKAFLQYYVARHPDRIIRRKSAFLEVPHNN